MYKFVLLLDVDVCSIQSILDMLSKKLALRFGKVTERAINDELN